MVFTKKIGDTVYYVAEIRTGRRKLVSATMWKQKEKTIPAGDSILSDPSRPQRFRNLPSLNPPSENISESQGENYSEAFGAGETEDARAFRSELAEVEADEPPTYKILKLGRLSLFLE